MGTRAKASAHPGRDGLKAAASGVLAGLLLGPLVGVLWLWIAPAPTAINTGGLIFLKDQNTSEFIAADGWFLIIGLVVGAVTGGAAFWFFRGRPGFAIAGLTLGGLVGSWIAWKVGVRLGPEPLQETASSVPEGGLVSAPISIRARGVLLGWPVGGLIAFISLYAGLVKPPPARAGDDGPADLPYEATAGAGLPALPTTPPRRAPAPVRAISRPGRGRPLGQAPGPGTSADDGEGGDVQAPNVPGPSKPTANGPPARGPTAAGPTSGGPTSGGPASNGRGPSVGADGRPGEFGTGQGR